MIIFKEHKLLCDLIISPLQPLLNHVGKDHLAVATGSSHLGGCLRFVSKDSRQPGYHLKIQGNLGAICRPGYLVDAPCCRFVQAVGPGGGICCFTIHHLIFSQRCGVLSLWKPSSLTTTTTSIISVHVSPSKDHQHTIQSCHKVVEC